MFLLPVHTVRWLAPDIFELELERRGYPFAPGACAVLFDDGDQSRPYSLASGPAEDVLRFLIRRLPGGVVSTWLSARRRGDGVRISTPFGRFHPGQEGQPGDPSVFIATGVGIAPFLSWVRSQSPSPLPSPAGGEGAGRARSAAAPSPPAGEGRGEGAVHHAPPICFYGVRHGRDAVHTELLRAHTVLRVAVSRESVPGCHHGRVTDLLPDLPLRPGTQYYLCGLDAMVDQTARWLDAHGVDPDHVHTEVFFNA